jgi:predicted RNase H-like HicB family nuclease
MMHNEFTYIVEPPSDDDPWFIAYCPELPEANGQGLSEEEAVANLRSAIGVVLQHRREEGLRGVPSDARRGVVRVG